MLVAFMLVKFILVSAKSFQMCLGASYVFLGIFRIYLVVFLFSTRKTYFLMLQNIFSWPQNILFEFTMF